MAKTVNFLVINQIQQRRSAVGCMVEEINLHLQAIITQHSMVVAVLAAIMTNTLPGTEAPATRALSTCAYR